jgi:5-methylcytosine-specific restriction protein B
VEHLKRLSTKLALVESLDFDDRKSEMMDDLSRLESKIHWSRDAIAEVLESLTDESPQIVLAGPPGTGKTFVAMELAKFILGYDDPDLMSRIKLVQFHPTYGYEEFIEGLRPAVGSSGSVAFERTPGVLLEMAAAIESDGKKRVLIIDEMNRANLPRVFGELLYALEYRDLEINLMLNQGFRLPSSLLIIGTMNSADKSIRALDAAFRRRFDFFRVAPDVRVLKDHFKARENSLGEELFRGFEELNNRLRSDIGESGYEVGHSYFMIDAMDARGLRRIWDRQLLPLIEDYFAGQESILSTYKLREFWNID